MTLFVIHESHFQGGTISYKVIGTNGSQLIVRITQTYTLILTLFGDATATLICIANCSTSGGYISIPIASKCTDYSVRMLITVGQ
ncbi:unnamed protein product [Rotaria sp. Silwood1]|nr:unnamed protein product [Rotaria sp. Silwood1]